MKRSLFMASLRRYFFKIIFRSACSQTRNTGSGGQTQFVVVDPS